MSELMSYGYTVCPSPRLAAVQVAPRQPQSTQFLDQCIIIFGKSSNICIGMSILFYNFKGYQGKSALSSTIYFESTLRRLTCLCEKIF